VTHLKPPSCLPLPADECPLGSRWHRNWRQYTLALTRTPEDRAMRDRLRAVADGRVLCRIALDWRVGPGDASLFGGRRTPPLTSAAHSHAAFAVAGHEIHLDRIEVTGGGPGFSLRAVVVHVDGESRGSGWTFGSLGGGGNSFPAFAHIQEELAVFVGFGEGQYNREPYVELRAATPTCNGNEGASG